MDTIDNILTGMRPKILVNDFDATETLDFQNNCLRPILKMQNDKFIMSASLWMSNLKNILALPDRRRYISEFLNKNPHKTQLLLGIVVGMMTNVEYNYFCTNTSDLSKRIKDMLIERIASQV
jgi:hypothetical protein